MNDTATKDVSAHEIASYVIAGTALLLVLKLHLLPALIAGLLVYELVHILAPYLRITRLSGARARLAVVSLLAVAVIVVLTLGIWGLVAFFRSDAGSVPVLLHKMAEIVEGSRQTLPGWLADSIPSDAEDVKNGVASWLREHAKEVQVAGREAGRVAAHILVGMVIGAVISLREITPVHEYRPLAQSLVERADRLSQAFRSIVFAQLRIAALNTFFAWLYLAVILPLCGIHLPLSKTMVAITFVTGLLPVIGNLISNAVIVIVGLSHSLSVAVASLVFLVVIHKLEYFLNARIVGSRIRAHTWEILLAMLIMEAAFGIAGVIAAPIYYAYVKGELSDRGLV
jgi:predicted PurR-regulated permease PerM